MQRLKLKLKIMLSAVIVTVLTLSSSASFAATGTGSDEITYPVYVGEVKMEQVHEPALLRGRLVPPDQADVYSTFGGDVLSLYVEEGDRVRKGTEIARVRRVDPGVTYEPERITAPVPGLVTRRYISQGSRITPQAPIVQIAREDTIIFRADMLERDRARIPIGTRGTITLADGSSFPDTPLGRILPYVDPQSQAIPADFFLPNKGGRMLTGTVGQVELVLDRHEAKTVPRDAVIEKNRQNGVFVVRDGIAHWQTVTILNDFGQRLEIRADALAPGDRVVAFGYESLSDGSRVEIRKDLRR